MSIDFTQRVQKYKNVTEHQQAIKAGADLVQLKYDGWWARAVIKNRSAKIYSRQGQLKDTILVGLPNCVLIGEFLKGTQRVVSGTEGEHSSLIVFDILELESDSDVHEKKYGHRVKIVQDILKGTDTWVKPCVTYSSVDFCERLWKDHVENGDCEGLVYKKSSDKYVGSTVWRRKREFTMDYVVMGVEEGLGKHSGRLGAIICGLVEGGVLVEKVRVGGGFNDREREHIWDFPDKYIGRVLEVKGWQVFDSGAMRHPNAVRGGDGKLKWRADKTKNDCVWPQ